MSGLDSLSPDQLEKYQQFVLVTNWDKDPNLPLIYLRAAQWNLEVSFISAIYLKANYFTNWFLVVVFFT